MLKALARQLFLATILANLSAPASAALNFPQAQRAFEQSFNIDQRITTQIMLAASGYTNHVPNLWHQPRRP